jgi:hypothetical protein
MIDRYIIGGDNPNFSFDFWLNDVLTYESTLERCGQIDDQQLNYDVVVFASPYFFVQKRFPYVERLKPCAKWLWKFQIYNS